MKKAFTLIELLIVVAIIAILAAIAVPNFLEAQTRSKISRVRNDQRTLATAMESYYVDNNAYPPEYLIPMTYLEIVRIQKSQSHLTTPIAYITSIPPDIFKPLRTEWEPSLYWYYNWLERYDTLINVNQLYGGVCPWYNEPAGWVFTSLGPDYDPDFPRIYDATNGTISDGDLSRLGPGGGGHG
jgi:general secretion pathway protein G